jgi:hypothetical protein
MKDMPASDALTMCFAGVGAVLGYLAFSWLLARGVYAAVLPGGFLGLAAGIPRSRSPMIAVLCGVLATGAGLFTEHRFAPFVADPSASYFLRHVFDLQPLTLVSIATGGLIGFWVPFRRRIRAAEATPTRTSR